MVVRFKITEHQQVTVRRVTFIGNYTVPDADLREVMQTGQGGIFSFGSGGPYRQDVFERDVERMREASPRAHLTKALPPALLVVGEHDFPMLAGDAQDYVAAARDLGREVPLVLAAGKDHMGVVAALLDDEDPTARAVYAFLDPLAFPEEHAGGAQPRR